MEKMTLEKAKQIITEEELVKKLPAFLHRKMSEEELDNLINSIWIGLAIRKEEGRKI